MSDQQAVWRDASSWRQPGSGGDAGGDRGGRSGWGRGGGQRQPRGQQDGGGESSRAIDEGRRIYVGNISYNTTSQNVEQFLGDNGFPTFDHVHISTDSFSGRNPGYCFVEFADKAVADEAIAALDGMALDDRQVKVRPCHPKGNARRQDDQGNSGYGRWGDRSRPEGEGSWSRNNAGRGAGGEGQRQFQVSKAQEEGRQVYVGGLPKLLDPAANEQEVRSIFQDFEVVGVSKRVSPREEGDGRRNFSFVDFSTAEQAQAAIDAVNRTEFDGAPLKVSLALPRNARY